MAVEHDENTLDPWAEEACDQIDAGFFSGDAFRGEAQYERMRFYLDRWQRQMAEIREYLDEGP